ncbi:MAG: hypothetical protein O3C43_19550 [Verrucomicrobia bacterium]|nr:hypothetical protein [Verrucomicrobiota bacterium]MDA1068687.1 hypothetical protein [Verrucomicrobiota bacterium]
MDGALISEKKIRRAEQISRVNSWSIIWFALLSTVVVLFLGNLYGVLVGLAVALGGYFELRGHRYLIKREASAIPWLVGSQLYLIVVLWGYSLKHLLSFDESNPWAPFSSGMKDFILAINPDVQLVEAMLKVGYFLVYLSLILAVLIYQGGLSLYYLALKKLLYPAA